VNLSTAARARARPRACSRARVALTLGASDERRRPGEMGRRTNRSTPCRPTWVWSSGRIRAPRRAGNGGVPPWSNPAGASSDSGDAGAKVQARCQLGATNAVVHLLYTVAAAQPCASVPV
jgi:hypothetical protein